MNVGQFADTCHAQANEYDCEHVISCFWCTANKGTSYSCLNVQEAQKGGKTVSCSHPVPPAPTPAPPTPPPTPAPPTPPPTPETPCSKGLKCILLDPESQCGPTDKRRQFTDGSGCSCNFNYFYNHTSHHCHKDPLPPPPPTPPPTTAVPTPAPGPCFTYHVARGDTCDFLEEFFGTRNVTHLGEACEAIARVLSVGEELEVCGCHKHCPIPTPPPTPPPTNPPTPPTPKPTPPPTKPPTKATTPCEKGLKCVLLDAEAYCDATADAKRQFTDGSGCSCHKGYTFNDKDHHCHKNALRGISTE